MRILVDFHHQALFYSLQLLFEKRLGWEFYRQIGMDWYHEGFWNIFPHPGTAEQFLSLDQASTLPRGMEGQPFKKEHCPNLTYRVEDGIYYVHDNWSHQDHAAVTLEKFKSMEFDVILSSVPQHIGPFNRLIQEFQPKAKHVFQVGNAWGHQPGVKNILASTAPFTVPAHINACFYHQEFNLDVFKFTIPNNQQLVHSYIHYMQNPQLFDQYSGHLPEWNIHKYGAGMSEHLSGSHAVAEAMQKSAFTWHYKPEGDGYGHVAYSSYASGRPAIIWGSFYRNKLAQELFIDCNTCIDISAHSIQENIKLIRRFSQPAQHQAMCERVYKRFKSVVNFEQEAQRIRHFISNLQ